MSKIPNAPDGHKMPVRMEAQLDLVDALQRRDTGMARVEQSAGTDWIDDATAYLREYARRARGEPFLIEDAIEVYTGTRPPNPKAWGPAAMMAAKRGWIRKAGYAPARSSNLSPKTLWQAP